MNIIEKVREIVQSFPKIAELCNTVHVDFADVEETSYGLSSMGDMLIAEDVTGIAQRRQHTFMLYATYSAISDYERLTNNGLLLELAIWLERQRGAITQNVLDETLTGEIERITTGNGALYAVPQGELADAVQYQLQIVVNYTLEEE